MTRDEAIKEIKSWDFLDKKETEAIETLIPELAESEDERIRKWLINYYSRMKWHFDSSPNTKWLYEDEMPCKDILAWLEKQKELPTNEEMLRTLRLEYEKVVADTVAKYEQKEQKPVEPSDDELQRHQKELYDFKVFAAKQAREHHISFVHDFEWNNFCAELLSYFNEKQKQEWSEEDEKMVNNILSVLGQYIDYKAVSGTGSGYATPRYGKEIDWLKSLRPQPHWKTSEGQEEPEYYQHFDPDC